MESLTPSPPKATRKVAPKSSPKVQYDRRTLRSRNVREKMTATSSCASTKKTTAQPSTASAKKKTSKMEKEKNRQELRQRLDKQSAVGQARAANSTKKGRSRK